MSYRSVLENQEAVISATASGNTEVVAAPGANRRVVLEKYIFITDTDVAIKFQSATTDKTGPMKPGANGGAESHVPLTCGDNEALNINLSGPATAVGGHCVYRVEEVIS